MKSTRIILYILIIGMTVSHILNNFSGMVGNGFLAMIVLLDGIYNNQIEMMNREKEEEGE